MVIAFTLLVAASASETIELHVHLEADVSAAWVERSVERFNAIFPVKARALVDERGSARAILSVRERDALSARVKRGEIHVFVVDKLADKSRKGVFIAGVHWRAKGKHFVIVSHSAARADTLAHELGHYFGLRHSSKVDNLMKRRPRARQTILDDGQRRAILRALNRGSSTSPR